MASRFSYGLTPSLAQEVVAAGGGAAWFERQVELAAQGDPAYGIADWFPELHRSPQQLWAAQLSGAMPGYEVMNVLASRELVRRIESPAQVLESMVEFWTNHLHVRAQGDNYFQWRVDYGDVVRRHALGRFEDLLAEAALHPAMLLYLNAGISTKAHPNENLGRELLELHTLGVGAYSEDDVKNAARILTGYRIDMGRTFEKSYVPADHWTGPVQVVDFTHPNPAADGQQVAAGLLSYLARHPLTARRVARKLVTWFVADQPSEALVERLAQVYLDHDTQVLPVLRALVASPELVASVGDKLRDPGQDVVATYRVLGARIGQPVSARSAAVVMRQQANLIGMQPYDWTSPDGAPLHGEAWATPARAMASTRVHWALGNGYSPNDADITYRTPQQWLGGQVPTTMRAVVAELSRQILVSEPPAGMLDTACFLARATPDEPIGPSHRALGYVWGQLVATFLDHPTRYRR